MINVAESLMVLKKYFNASRMMDHTSPLAEALLSLGLFLLALLPRAYDLQRFVTADEAKWVYRSAQFLAALGQGDFAATSVNLTPAVTTTWLGSLGLALYYHQLNQAVLHQPLGDWLRSLPEFRVELDVLVAVRWPMVVFTALGVVAIYFLARRLFNPTLAFIAAVFIALDPHTVALSRILGHDAPAAVFMSLSMLLLLLGINKAAGPPELERGAIQREHRPIFSASPSQPLIYALSGIAAGLAFLSKAPALFLIPFTGLVFISQIWKHGASRYFWLKRGLLWAVAAYLTFVIVWPAAWVDPLGRPLAVVENAFLSAADQEEADGEGYWLVPDLGPFYYIVNGGFKLSPLVMAGAGLALIFIVMHRRSYPSPRGGGRWRGVSRGGGSWREVSRHGGREVSHGQESWSGVYVLLWLLAFSLLFTLFMTAGDKRSPRYILPVFPPLAIVAAFGWLQFYQVTSSRITGRRAANPEQHTPQHSITPLSQATFHVSRFTSHISPFIFSALLTISALIIILPYAPYYFTYFNPLLGGPLTAPQWVKIGWGEGLDRVGRFLQRELDGSRVGTAYASTVAPFFKGDLSGVTGASLDYVTLYSKQVQSGEPAPAFIRYYQMIGPIFSVELNGIHYADVYPGPAIQPAQALISGLDAAPLPQPIGFRPLTPQGRIGETLEVDVLWLADDPLPVEPATVALGPLSVLEASPQVKDVIPDEPVAAMLATGSGRLSRLGNNLVISRHNLMAPADLERGAYALQVNGQPLGEIELRHFRPPSDMRRVNDLVFDDQIALVAFQFTPASDYIGLRLAWQAQRSRLPDYTVFVQLLDAETNERLAGVDTQPVQGSWPTGRWLKDEVVVDEYLVAAPYDLQPGFYKVIAGLYRPETGQRLTLPDGQDHWIVPWIFIRK